MRHLRLFFAACLLTTPALAAEPSASLVGTWTLARADQVKADGSRVSDYGENPQGLLVLGRDGRYSLQIYRSDRAPFASPDKKLATAAEFQAASLGMSAHFGRYTVDAEHHTLTFEIEQASFPNWNGTRQVRPFEIAGDELSYRVPPRPDGTVPISVWRRAR